MPQVRQYQHQLSAYFLLAINKHCVLFMQLQFSHEERETNLEALGIKVPPTLKATPDVWFTPELVWEVAFGDLTVSKTYTAGAQQLRDGETAGKDNGVGIRFPRFVRSRSDKSITQATSDKELVFMYSSVHNYISK